MTHADTITKKNGMHMKMKTTLITAAIALAGASYAQAEVKVNGFANLVAGKASDPVYGYDTDLDFSTDSAFAIQLSADINSNTTATAQLLSRGSDNYDADFEWAYLTHTLTPSSRISAGRLRLPLYRYSDSLDVGYSYHFISAPSAVYDTPYNNIDGVRYDYSGFSGALDYSFQVAAGQSDTSTTRNGIASDVKISNAYLVSAEVGYDNLRGRTVYAKADVSIDSAPLTTGTALLENVDASLANLLRAEDDSGLFFGVGVDYDNGAWFMSAEYTYNKVEDSFLPDQDSYYVTAGLRSGKWTPFVVYEAADRQGDPKFSEQLSIFPVPVQEQIKPLVDSLQAGSMFKNNAATAGVRYDWDTNIALKADITRYEDRLNRANDSTLSRVAVNYIF